MRVSQTRDKVDRSASSRARLGPGRFTIEVSNRRKHGGKDEHPAATHEGTGVGLANVCQRLEARFGALAKCALWPDGRRRLSSVLLTLPLDRSDG